MLPRTFATRALDQGVDVATVRRLHGARKRDTIEAIRPMRRAGQEGRHGRDRRALRPDGGRRVTPRMHADREVGGAGWGGPDMASPGPPLNGQANPDVRRPA